MADRSPGSSGGDRLHQRSGMGTPPAPQPPERRFPFPDIARSRVLGGSSRTLRPGSWEFASVRFRVASNPGRFHPIVFRPGRRGDSKARRGLRPMGDEGSLHGVSRGGKSLRRNLRGFFCPGGSHRALTPSPPRSTPATFLRVKRPCWMFRFAGKRLF